MEISKTIIFNGVTYTLMGAGKYYLSQSTNKGRKGAKGLHRAIWEHYSGKVIPPNHDIHHIDGNTFNNSFDNLQCLSKREHANVHIAQGDWNRSAPTELARKKAAEWHRSEEGRKWHREKAAENWQNIKQKQLECIFCGNTYLSPFSDTLYCSDSCGRKYRLREGSKLFCTICNSDITLLDSRSKYCSKECKAVARRERERK